MLVITRGYVECSVLSEYPGKTSSSAWDPGLATLPPGRLPCYPDIPHQRAKRSTYWNFPIRGFRRKLLQKEENSKETSKIWVVSYGLQGTGCHFAIYIYIYISIQWPVQLHQSNLLKNLQISFLPRKFLAFHAPVALLAVLTNKNSSFYVCPWSPSTKTSLKDSSDTPQRVYQSTLNDHHTWQCVKTWYR